MTVPAFSEWVCDYCRRPEEECVAVQRGLSITVVDKFAAEEEQL